MKVDGNITLFAGDLSQSSPTTDGTEKKQIDRKTVFAGTLNVQGDSLQERIEKKKKEAQEQAMKVIGDAFAGDKALSDQIDNMRQQIEDLKTDHKRLQDEIANVESRGEDLEKAYEAGEISEEDYAAEKDDLQKELKIRNSELHQTEDQIKGLGRSIYGVKIESLKHHTMTDAQEQAQQIKDAAGDEIVGMAVEGGMDHIEEEAEEREEKADKLKEEKDQQEERIEEQKEHLEEQEDQIKDQIKEQRQNRREQEEILENIPVDEMITYDQMQSDVQQEVQDILQKMKLLEEDIKGAVVDKNL